AAGEPPLTGVHDALQRVATLPSQEHRWMWLLRWLGPAPDGIEVDVLTVEFGDVFRPDFFHGPYLPPHFHKAGFIDLPVFFHLSGVPPSANTKKKTPAREPIQAGDFFG